LVEGQLVEGQLVEGQLIESQLIEGQLIEGQLLLTLIDPLTPNAPYKGRTAPLTSKVAFYIFIKQI